jgi:hypothetical protein
MDLKHKSTCVVFRQRNVDTLVKATSDCLRGGCKRVKVCAWVFKYVCLVLSTSIYARSLCV